VDFVIPGNDDALRSIRLFASRMAEAVLHGRGIKESADAESARPSGDGDSGDDRRQAPRPPRRTREAAPASA
jgi:small subunit ribosomal protein S2